jgi:hypothetical protein
MKTGFPLCGVQSSSERPPKTMLGPVRVISTSTLLENERRREPASLSVCVRFETRCLCENASNAPGILSGSSPILQEIPVNLNSFLRLLLRPRCTKLSVDHFCTYFIYEVGFINESWLGAVLSWSGMPCDIARWFGRRARAGPCSNPGWAATRPVTQLATYQRSDRIQGCTLGDCRRHRLHWLQARAFGPQRAQAARISR